MNYVSTLLAVNDINASKQFYKEVLGLEVIADFGANITLTGGIALQTLDTWTDFIHKPKDDITFGHQATELYFEEDNFDLFLSHLNKRSDINYVHPLQEHSWGQRVIRFYDLDRHIIEVGENMVVVVKRFVTNGLSSEETAIRMDVPLDYIKYCLSLPN